MTVSNQAAVETVLQISGGVGILGVHILFLVGLLPLLSPASTAPNGLSDEESKSLWHIMAQSALAVDAVDRERFLDLCLKRRVLCEPSRLDSPTADFKWRAGVTMANKNRFWHAYTCVYNANLTQCPVDGEWSPWSPWSSCSATCDATGSQTRTRTCSNPVPVRGGERCSGSTMRSRPCLGTCRGSPERGGVEGAEAFLKQVHEAYPSLLHDCYNAHCTYGVVQKVVAEKHVRWTASGVRGRRGASVPSSVDQAHAPEAARATLLCRPLLATRARGSSTSSRAASCETVDLRVSPDLERAAVSPLYRCSPLTAVSFCCCSTSPLFPLTAVPPYRCSPLPLFPLTAVPPYRCSPLLLFPPATVPPYRCSPLPLFPPAAVPPYRCFPLPLFPLAPVPSYRCSPLLLFPPATVPPYRCSPLPLFPLFPLAAVRSCCCFPLLLSPLAAVRSCCCSPLPLLPLTAVPPYRCSRCSPLLLFPLTAVPPYRCSRCYPLPLFPLFPLAAVPPCCCSPLPLFPLAVVPPYHCSPLPLFPLTAVPPYRCSPLLLFPPATVPPYRCSPLPLFPLTAVPPYRCSPLPLFPLLPLTAVPAVTPYRCSRCSPLLLFPLTAVPPYRCSPLPLFPLTAVPPYRCSPLLLFPLTTVPPYRCSPLPLFPLAVVPPYHCSPLPLFPLAVVPPYRCSPLPLFPLAVVPPYHCSPLPLFPLTAVPPYRCSPLLLFPPATVPPYRCSRCFPLPLFPLTAVPPYRCSPLPLFPLTAVPSCCCSPLPLFPLTAVPPYRCSPLPLFPLTAVPPYRCSPLPLFPLTAVPPYRCSPLLLFPPATVPPYRCSRCFPLPLFPLTAVPPYRCPLLLLFPLTAVPPYRCSPLPLFPLTAVPPYRCSPLPLFPLTAVPAVPPCCCSLLPLFPFAAVSPLTAVPPYCCSPLPLFPLTAVSAVPPYRCSPLTAVPPYRCSPLPLLTLTSVPPHRCSPLPLFPLTAVSAVPPYRCYPLPLFPLTAVPPYRCSPLPLSPLAAVPPYRCSPLPLFPLTAVSAVPPYRCSPLPLFPLTAVSAVPPYRCFRCSPLPLLPLTAVPPYRCSPLPLFPLFPLTAVSAVPPYRCFRCSPLPLLPLTAVPPYRCSPLPLFPLTAVPSCCCSPLPLFPLTAVSAVPPYRCSPLLLFPLATVPPWHCSPLALFPLAAVSPWHCSPLLLFPLAAVPPRRCFSCLFLTPLNVSCGGYGRQKATRVCLRHAGCDLQGIMTPYVNRSRPCYTGDCPSQGGWSDWTDWTECSSACGVGRQSRARTCDSPFPSGGLDCMGDGVDFRLCKGQRCAGQPRPPENTDYLRKGDDANEEVSLGQGDEYIGGPLNPPMEGLYTPWASWARCSATCGLGLRVRKRWCSSNTTPIPPCEGEIRQFQFCNVFVCPALRLLSHSTSRLQDDVYKHIMELGILHNSPPSTKCGCRAGRLHRLWHGLPPAPWPCTRSQHHSVPSRNLHPLMVPPFLQPHPDLQSAVGNAPLSSKHPAQLPTTDCLLSIISPMGGQPSDAPALSPPSPLQQGGQSSNAPALSPPSPLPQGGQPIALALSPPSPPPQGGQPSDAPGLSPSSSTLLLCPSDSTLNICHLDSQSAVKTVSGSWSVWLPWTPCSKTCGMGKRQRYRECSNPLPQFGGSCLGDSMRVDECEIGPCPRISSGTWSSWSAWTQCTVSCSGGQRSRTRNRQGYSGGSSSIPSENSDEPPQGSRETLDCNTQPCPKDGSWAEWGEWSRCSAPCGLGRRVRDRTCTDPSPVFGGHVCPGPGTDLAHCFAGPCKDSEDKAVYMGTTSWIRFAPHNRPSRFLVIYLHFKPMAPAGTLLRRYRQCRSVFDDDDNEKEDEAADDGDEKKNKEKDKKADEDVKCQLVVDVHLEQAEVKIAVVARGAHLEINSPVALSLGSWHEILVEVLKTGASLRVNDHERLFSNFSRPLYRDLDFDSYMVLGAIDNKTVGLVGSIASLGINFLTQDLYSYMDWQGQGTPVGRHAVSVQSINPSVQLPHFQGLYYSPVRLYHTERLSVRMTLALDAGEGLLLYCPGKAEGTFVTLGLKQSRFVLCMICTLGERLLCHHGDLLRLHQWYHISLLMEDTEAELRVDQGKALQLTCKGMAFKPRNALFVGGRSAAVWEDVQKLSNYTNGFFGVLGTLVVNGRTISFRQAVLMGRDDRINLDGYSRTTRITPVFEHKSSIVMLHCEVEITDDPAAEVKVIWLLRDAVLEPSEHIEIVKPVGLTKRVGTLQLRPSGHTEGIYACVVSRDGRLQMTHVFPVFRHPPRQDLYEGRMEWVFLTLLLILLPLLAICCIAYKFVDLEPEKEPLLPTEPMDVWKPDKPHLHGQDDQSTWDNYLVQPEGGTEQTNVVSFGPPQHRRLSATPGVYTDRPLNVSAFGQVKLGEPPRPTVDLYYVNTDHMEGFDAQGATTFPPMGSDPVYANVTHNRPRDVTCRQQQPIIRPRVQTGHIVTSHRRKSGDLNLSAVDRGTRAKAVVRYSPTKDPRLSRARRKSHHSSPRRAKDASSHSDRRQTKRLRKRSYSRDSRTQKEAENEGDKHSKGGILTSRTRDKAWWATAPSTDPAQRKTSHQRSRSEDPSRVRKPGVAFLRASPPFDLHQYQQLRVRVPEPVVYSRNQQSGVGSSAKRRTDQTRRNSQERKPAHRDDGTNRRRSNQGREPNQRRNSSVSTAW
ncbi:hypothetical protein ACOMHN_046397 [Nucella lapillus]